ncbi:MULTISPECIES: glycosyltransferase [unclassified Vibrio]|nr:glycosyltransferase [Vibrio sp. 10N.261.54.E10]PMK13553.1 hypothetical protein BCU07_06315 [Vibrio sp. 10N.261.54.E10]
MKIGVIICIYKPHYSMLEEQVRSISNQRKKVDTIYFFDDSPEEAFESNCKFISELFTDPQAPSFEAHQGPRKGVIENFLSALNYVKEDVIFFSDQDDTWLPNKVELFAKEFEHTKEAKLVFSDAKVVSEDLTNLSDSFIRYLDLPHLVIEDDTILVKNCVQGASMAINSTLADIVLESSSYVDNKNIPMHDWWIAVLARFFGEYTYINEPTLLYRQHENNLVGANRRTLKDRFRLDYLIVLYKVLYQTYKVNEIYYSSSDKVHLRRLKIRGVSFVKIIIIKTVSFFSYLNSRLG